MQGTFSPTPRVSDPDMHHGTCVTHVPWCMSGSLNGGFLWSRWRGKCSRYSRRMRNLQFYVSGKRLMELIVVRICGWVREYSWGDSLWDRGFFFFRSVKKLMHFDTFQLHLLNNLTYWTPRGYQMRPNCWSLSAVGGARVGAVPTTSSSSTQHLASIDCTKTTLRWDEEQLRVGIWCGLY